MEAVDVFWIASCIVLAVVALLRFRAGVQRIGSLLVAAMMTAAAVAIFYGQEKLAYALQVGGVLSAGASIALYERWRRTRKQDAGTQ